MAAIVYVSLDFLIDFRPVQVHSSYRFTLKAIPFDQPQWLQQDNLTVLLIKRSEATIERLQRPGEDLQDQDSKKSEQPDYAMNSLRSRYPTYFISYANGTDFGCLLELESSHLLAEICGKAKYDFAGRALISNNRFQNLTIPDYNFNDDFSILTIKP